MSVSSNISSSVSQLFERTYGRLKKDNNIALIQSFTGDLADGISHELCTDLEVQLAELSLQKRSLKRTFSIVIEGLQNMRMHGEFDDEGKKIVQYLFFQKQNILHFRFSNLILKNERASLEDYVKTINALDKNGLKQKYLNRMSNGVLSANGGAGLGLMTMSMKSEHPIRISFDPLSEKLVVVNLDLELVP
ncbi:MAG: DUF6272 family protein [Bacteroidota bacterium]